jgi:hypothetical protein
MMAKCGPKPKVSDDAMRAVWADPSLVGWLEKSRALGMPRTTFFRRAIKMGLPIVSLERPVAPQGRVQPSDDQILAVWADASLTSVAKKAEVLGITEASAYCHAARLGLHLPGRARPVEPPADYSPEVPVDAARRLFQAVILERWRVAMDRHCRDRLTDYDVAAARRWFGSSEYQLFCLFAEVDADALMQRYREKRGRLIDPAAVCAARPHPGNPTPVQRSAA